MMPSRDSAVLMLQVNRIIMLSIGTVIVSGSPKSSGGCSHAQQAKNDYERLHQNLHSVELQNGRRSVGS